jgi:hypothetical protein
MRRPLSLRILSEPSKKRRFLEMKIDEVEMTERGNGGGLWTDGM